MYRRRKEEIQKDYWLYKKYIDSHPKVSSLRQNPRDFEKNMEKIFDKQSKVVIDASITGVNDFEEIKKILSVS